VSPRADQPRDTGIWNDRQAEAWRPIVDFLHGEGASPASSSPRGPQGLDLPGVGSDGAAPCPAEEADGRPSPPRRSPSTTSPCRTRSTARSLAAVVARFVAAARRAIEVGFDVVEVHAAHGYLLHEFLSPCPTADDDYGGIAREPRPLLLEIVARIRPSSATRCRSW
jgi:2,4-dienoyl-CoA reductase-like NADH-dependent reductase (Old Yellow Enzyme family)